MRAEAVCPPPSAVTRRSNTRGVSMSTAETSASRKNFPMAAHSSSLTEESTSSSLEASPATTPAAAAASMPRSPPVCGTTTLFTFFTMLPLASIVTLCGVAPRSSRAHAAA